jgi:hypothetical protein
MQDISYCKEKAEDSMSKLSKTIKVKRWQNKKEMQKQQKKRF